METGNKSSCCGGLSICNLGTSLGIVWGLGMVLITVMSMLFGIGTPFVDIFSSIYWGLDTTIPGIFFGLFWGFVDGFIIGALVAFFYNFCQRRCPCSTCKTNRECCK